MAVIKRLVGSEVEGRTLSDRYGDSAYYQNYEGRLDFHSEDGDMLPVIKPGVVYGANNDSADLSGFNTFKIVPDETLVGSDQYLVVEPTQPNHIHIRAGGYQDNSQAELILGAEDANVRILDYSHTVHITTYDSNANEHHSWSFGNDGVLYGPEGVVKPSGGVSGSFTTADNKVVTVTYGIITDITQL